MPSLITLVRHGNYDSYDRINKRSAEVLIPEGEAQAVKAGETLLEKGLGEGALILSSDAPRAAQTAQIIAGIINCKDIILSSRLNIWGNRISAMQDLDGAIAQSLHEEASRDTPEHGLIVVAHAPIVATALAIRPRDVAFGGVYDYEPGTWRNYDFAQRTVDELEPRVQECIAERRRVE